MDKSYLQQVLRNLERMKAVHDQEFSGNEHHEGCQPRIEKAIEKLCAEVGQEEQAPRLDFSVSQSALPDAIEKAGQLESAARKLEEENDPQAAPLRRESQKIVAKELNELDGFDR
jgi:hypothetical protein